MNYTVCEVYPDKAVNNKKQKTQKLKFNFTQLDALKVVI